jgi:hypothetical protein
VVSQATCGQVEGQIAWGKMTILELTLTPEQGPPRCYRFKVSDDLARTVMARLLALLVDEQPPPSPNGSKLSNGSLAARVYGALSKLADPSGWCRAYQAEIASQASLSTRHLRRGIGALEAAGLVQVRRGPYLRNAYFLPQLADKTESAADKVLSGMKEDSGSAGLSAMIHDDDERKKQFLLFLHEGQRRKRLQQSHLTPEYLQAWDSWWSAGQFGHLRNPAGWANSEIKQGHWPPARLPTLFEAALDAEALASAEPAGIPPTPEEALWTQVLAHLQLQLPRATFDIWLKDSRLVKREGYTFTLATRSAFARDWLENRLQPTLGRVIAQVTQSDPAAIKLLFVVA